MEGGEISKVKALPSLSLPKHTTCAGSYNSTLLISTEIQHPGSTTKINTIGLKYMLYGLSLSFKKSELDKGSANIFLSVPECKYVKLVVP